MNKSLLTVVAVTAGAMLLPDLAAAANNAVELPSWANEGNLDQELSSKGQSVANTLSSIVAILAVIGMLVGAAFFPMNKAEQGKQWVMGGGIGLIISASVYGIAALFL